jgi:hypothetical protein
MKAQEREGENVMRIALIGNRDDVGNRIIGNA